MIERPVGVREGSLIDEVEVEADCSRDMEWRNVEFFGRQGA